MMPVITFSRVKYKKQIFSMGTLWESKETIPIHQKNGLRLPEPIHSMQQCFHELRARRGQKQKAI